ncbi:hypothetical protein GGS23DRAFT_318648 [Durotheca rogersii]|uniref:uncharacterized protein n=1 Tax=Durotheca rogersii TaxID=419775 RepID=UPI00221F5743|nr:uncharacterized protein GGS23DRAFT_318648 [Durotheca rogersii]KAI5859461.1 hypothetical protein GGS23DRAFT_318648 [Durotheca rogersii]
MTPKAIRATLEDLRNRSQRPGGDEKSQLLTDTYEKVMERIAGQLPDMKDLAMDVLSWISWSEPTIHASSLQKLLAAESGKSEIDEDNMPDTRDTVSVCAGLVTIDGESGIIRLAHYTTQTYLEHTRDRWFPESLFKITKVCISLLSFRCFPGEHTRSWLGLCDQMQPSLSPGSVISRTNSLVSLSQSFQRAAFFLVYALSDPEMGHALAFKQFTVVIALWLHQDVKRLLEDLRNGVNNRHDSRGDQDQEQPLRVVEEYHSIMDGLLYSDAGDVELIPANQAGDCLVERRGFKEDLRSRFFYDWGKDIDEIVSLRWY